jgi:hypothetical protein
MVRHSRGGPVERSIAPLGMAGSDRTKLSPLSPQKYESCDQPKNASSGMKNAPPPDHAARFSRGTARRCVHQAAIGRHDHEDRVGPIYQQGGGSDQPSPLEVAEKRNGSEEALNPRLERRDSASLAAK